MRTLISLFILGLVLPAWSQSSSPLTTAAGSRPPPALMAIKDGRAQSVQLTDVKIEARIVGHLAETAMTLTFFNPQPRALAGDLYFPLPEGATVSGYALDIDGRMVEGVVVPKERARQIFEAETRKGIDPGLMEWIQGHNFRTRIFPIPAQGSRTVQVKYVAELTSGPQGATYHLPLDFRHRVRSFALRIEAVQAATRPVIARGGPAGLKFMPWRDSFVAETRQQNATLTQDLDVNLPPLARQPVQVERAPDGFCYFAVHQEKQLPAEPTPRIPQRLLIFWDASGSRAKTTHEPEIEGLQGYLARLAGTPVAVDLVFFRNTIEPPRRFDLPAQQEALLETLRAVDYDGGTQLGSLAVPAGLPPDLILLFSDGVSTFGIERPDFDSIPLYAINSSSTANYALLRHLAQRSGGDSFNLSRLRPEQVANRIGTPAHALLKVKVQGADLADLYPRLPYPVHDSLILAGRLQSREAMLILSYGVGDRVLDERRLTVRCPDTAAEGDLLRRHWAQKKLDELLAFPDDHAEAIATLGRDYGLVTPGTSLLVLVQYHIRPPASLPGLRAEYDRRLEQQALAQSQAQQDRLQIVLKQWQDYQAWWSQTYRYPKGFRYQDRREQQIARSARPGAASGWNDESVRPAPAAPAATAPPMVLAVEPPPPRPMLMDIEQERTAAEERTHRMFKRSMYEEDTTTPDNESTTPEVTLKPWNPDTPYLKTLKAAPAPERWTVYLRERAAQGTAPAFFLDCADFFQEQGETGRALQVLSNIAELELENPALLRVLAHRLAQWDQLDLAILLFSEVLELRPEEPQSHRDLALALERRADAHRASDDPQQRESAKADYARALELLAKVVMSRWDRFAEIELIALIELNHIVPKARAAGVERIPLDPRLLDQLDLDLRIVMTWDTDLTDLDLHVVEPSGEEAYYSHNRTTIGGRVSRDFTQGYGPEFYALRRAMPGPYQVKTHFFGSTAVQLTGAVTLQVEIFTRYGRPDEQRRSITLRLNQPRESLAVGEITF